MVSTTNSLKINVVTIPEEGLNFVFSESGKWFSERVTEEESAGFSIEKAEVNCLITKTSGTVFIKGNLSATVSTNCSRCLEETNIPVSSEFAYTLVPQEPQNKEEWE